MTKILVVYDNTGYVIYQEVGDNIRIPLGLQHILTDLPLGKQLKVTGGIGVDTSKTPHKVAFENVPLDGTQLTLKQLQQQMTLMMSGLLDVSFQVHQLNNKQDNEEDVIGQLARLLATIKGGA